MQIQENEILSTTGTLRYTAGYEKTARAETWVSCPCVLRPSAVGGLFTPTIPQALILPMLGAMTATISSSPAKQDAQRQEGDPAPAVLRSPGRKGSVSCLRKGPRTSALDGPSSPKASSPVTTNCSDKELLPALPVVLARAS